MKKKSRSLPLTPHERPLPDFSRALDFFLKVFAGLSLLILPWFYGLSRFRDQLLFQMIIFSVFLGVILCRPWSRILRVKTTSMDLWFLASVSLAGFSVLVSALPSVSFPAFLKWSAVFLFYALFRRILKTERDFYSVLWTFLAAGVFYSVYGILQARGYLPSGYWYVPSSAASRYVNGGHFAVFLLLCIGMGIGLFASKKNPVPRAVIAGALAVMGWALLLTRGRAAWLSFAVGFGIFFFLLFREKNQRKQAGVIGTAVLGFFTLLAFRGTFSDIATRFSEFESTRFYSVHYRLQIWREAWAALLARPWGWGAGTFKEILPQFKLHTDRFVVDYPHNEILHTGVDLGFLGILLLFAFSADYFRRAFGFLMRQNLPASKRFFAIVFIVIAMSFVLTSLVDFPLRIYANTLYLAVFLALSSYLFEVEPALQEKRPETLRLSGKGIRILTFFLLIAAIAGGGRQLFAQLAFEKGMKLEKDFAYPEAVRQYERAVRSASQNAEYHQALGEIKRRLGKLSLNRTDRKKWTEEALLHYQAAAALQPYKSSYRFVLSQLLEKSGRIGEAKKEFRKALQLDPMNELILAEYGYFSIQHGFVEEGISSFQKFHQVHTYLEGGEYRSCDILRACYQVTQDYPQLLRVISDDIAGHRCFARLLTEKQALDLAKREWESVLTLNPGDAEARAQLGMML